MGWNELSPMRAHCSPYMHFTPALFHAAQQRILLALWDTDRFFQTHHLSVFLDQDKYSAVCLLDSFQAHPLLLLGVHYIRPHIWTVWKYIRSRAKSRSSLQFAPVFENLQLTTKKTKEVSLHAARDRKKREKQRETEREKERKNLTQDLQCVCSRPLSNDLIIFFFFFFNALLLNPFHWTYHGHKREFLYLYRGSDHIVP